MLIVVLATVAASCLAIARRWQLDEAQRELARSEAEVAIEVARAAAEARERQRLADGLHDGPLQDLAVLRMRLDVVADTLAHDAASAPAAAAAIADAATAASAIADELRQLLATIRPTPDGLGREDQSRFLRALTARGGGHGVALDVDGELVDRVPDELFDVLCRLVNEGLANARRHAAAASVRVCVRGGAAGGVAEVVDDGAGFDVSTIGLAADHLGLDDLARRAARAGATLDVESAPGAGTVVRLRWPAP